MSRILDGIRARHWWTKATGTVTGDPTPSDSAAMQKRLQQRLLDCVLLRKYEEALLLLDALLSEKRFNINDYWKVLVPIVQQMFPEHADEVIRGAYNSTHRHSVYKASTSSLLFRMLATRGDYSSMQEFVQDNTRLRYSVPYKIAAMAELKRVDVMMNSLERLNPLKRPVTTEDNIYTTDSECYTSDSDEDQPRRNRGPNRGKRRRYASPGNEDSKKPEVINLDDETSSIDSHYKPSKKKTINVNSKDEDTKKKKKTGHPNKAMGDDSDASFVFDSDEDEDGDSSFDSDDSVAHTDSDGEVTTSVAKWSMPPRLFYMDLSGCSVGQLTRTLDLAAKGHLDLDAVKMRLMVHSAILASATNAKERAEAKESFHKVLAEAMSRTQNNAPLIRVLLPFFSHYSDEWLKLMQQYCSLDPTANLEDGLKRYELRSRKIVSAAKDDQYAMQEQAISMTELLLERISHGCLEKWTLVKLIMWIEMLEPQTRKAICNRETWLGSFLQAEIGRAASDVASHIDYVYKQYFKPTDTQ